MKIGSLFSGIGGLELGLERAGFGEVVWQCEKVPHCQKVLAEHWPHAIRFKDVVNLRPPPVDVLCGGFPCQDVSAAGKRVGMAGARSGLWYEYARIIEAIRPTVVVVENVASGARKWLPLVRAQLHLLGYDTVAANVRASDVGAPHERSRVFVFAIATDADRKRILEQCNRRRAGTRGTAVDTSRHGGEGSLLADDCGAAWEWRDGQVVNPVPMLANGLSARLARDLRSAGARALGNAVVPQCAEYAAKWFLRLLHESP